MVKKFKDLPIEEIGFWPELSSPTNFRIQEGYPERDKVRMKRRKCNLGCPEYLGQTIKVWRRIQEVIIT